MPRKKLRLYVWEDVLCDWTCGVMFALAYSEDEARRKILEHTSYVPGETFEYNKPLVVEEPRGWAVYGGG